MISGEMFHQIAKRFGTPVYVYDRSIFVRQLQTLARAIDWRPLVILFAIKANENHHILRLFAKEILPKDVCFGVDAVSPGEIALALKTGIKPTNIIYTGNNASCDEIAVAKTAGILPNIDSLSKLRWYCQKYPNSSVCIRINPNVGAGHHDHCITGGPESKFGIWFSEAKTALEIADKRAVKIVGLHQHIGSQILEPAKFLQAMEMMFQVAPIFPWLCFIDFGGGLGIPYKPDEFDLDMQKLGKEMSVRFGEYFKRNGRPLRMIIEPGRYLTAQAGFLLVQVTDVKDNPDGRVFIGVNSGFNHLDRPARYGSYHEIRNVSNPDGPMITADIVGHLCESGDKFATNRQIAIPTEGHLLVIENAGAYGFSMASHYNLWPLPPEVMVYESGFVREIRKRERIEDLI